MKKYISEVNFKNTIYKHIQDRYVFREIKCPRTIARVVKRYIFTTLKISHLFKY